MASQLEQPHGEAVIEASRIQRRPPRAVPKELAPVWNFWRLLRREQPDLDQAQRDRLAEAAIQGIVEALPASPDELAVVWEAWGRLSDSYLRQEELDPAKLSQAAILSMTAQLEQPHGKAVIEASRIQGRPPQAVPDELATVWNFWRLLRREQPDLDQVQRDRLAEAAVQGMVEALGTSNAYISTDSQRPEQLTGQYQGIGAVMVEEEGKLIVVDLVPDGPADKAGLKPGDTILAVDGEPVEGLSIQEGTERIRGPSGTEVVLKVEREGKSLEVPIERGPVQLRSVRAALAGEGIAYMRVETFYDTTGQE